MNNNFQFKSGVDRRHYREYHFSDHLWSRTEPPRRDLMALAAHCVQVNGDYFVKNPAGHWLQLESKAAKRHLENTLTGRRLSDGTQVTPELIDSFFTGKDSKVLVGSCPVFSDRVTLPLCPSLVTVDDVNYLNDWRDLLVRPDFNAWDESVALLMTLIWGSLCAAPFDLDNDSPVEFGGKLIGQIVENDWADENFRFVVNWLAAIYQTPGINLQTNLWLTGATQGIGKGTLYQVMQAMLGRSYCTKLHQREIERGWTDALMGKQLIMCDEFDGVTKNNFSQVDWDTWIKQMTCEPTVTYVKRNAGQVERLNISNYLFLTNESHPINVSVNDRRNAFIATTNNAGWRSYAATFQNRHFKIKSDRIAAGFAAVLSQVNVDFDLLTVAPKTQRKEAIKRESMSSVERWLLADTRIRGAKMYARATFAEFEDWAEDNNVEKITSNKFGRMMSNAVEKGWAARGEDNKGNYYTFPEYVDNVAPQLGDRAARDLAGALDQVDVPDYPIPISSPKMSHALAATRRAVLAEIANEFDPTRLH